MTSLIQLPPKAQVSQRIYVKDIVAALGATGQEKTLIEKSIKEIHLFGIANENTSGIWKYSDDTLLYEEIQFFHILLKDKTKVKSLNEEIQKVFPNPILVVYEYKNEFLMSTAMKRLNKSAKDKTVIDSITTTGWFLFDELHKELFRRITFDFSNLKDFYENADCILSADYLIKITGTMPEKFDFSIKLKAITIEKLLEEKNKLLAQQEESSMQAKMQCHIKIQEIESKIKSTI